MLQPNTLCYRGKLLSHFKNQIEWTAQLTLVSLLRIFGTEIHFTRERGSKKLGGIGHAINKKNPDQISMKRLDPIIKVVISMILLWPSSSAVLAQNNSQYLVDSVLLKLAVMPTDTSKVDSLSRIAYLMHLHDPIAGIEFSRIALQLADSLDYQRGMARSESTWGLNYYSLTEFPKAVEHTLKALEMRNFIAERKARKLEAGLPYFEVRIGVHTGPVVAGIVGVKKFSYDIWGDTVNTANRMESSSSVGQVNISQATYALIKDDTSFVFKHRGKIEAKGKGELEMYFVDLKSNTG